MFSTIFFDLDGTLLPMDQEVFTKTYFSNLAKTMAARHEPETLISAVWAGTRAMIKNDGSRFNSEAFWDTYAGIFGEDARNEEPAFADFYETKFMLAADQCRKNPLVPELVGELKAAGYRLVIATNPLFPMTAQRQRITWAGLDPQDFEWITSYENSRYCKPNPAYYQSILDEIGVSAEDVLMVGNDVKEDMAAEKAGLKVFLLTDCLLNTENLDYSVYPNGDLAALRSFIDANGFQPLGK